jgi:hypothetical protein
VIECDIYEVPVWLGSNEVPVWLGSNSRGGTTHASQCAVATPRAARLSRLQAVPFFAWQDWVAAEAEAAVAAAAVGGDRELERWSSELEEREAALAEEQQRLRSELLQVAQLKVSGGHEKAAAHGVVADKAQLWEAERAVTMMMMMVVVVVVVVVVVMMTLT